MRQFNHNLTTILELNTKEIDTALPTNDIATPHDRAIIKKVLKQYREGDVDADRAAQIMVDIGTKRETSKPLNAVADFVDILNQGSSASGVINTSALRKLADSLEVKTKALEGLNSKDIALSLKLIKRGYQLQ